MVTVTQNQAFQRWDSIPVNLRDALISETNSEFLWRICESEHLPKEKINNIARIFGHVLLGFIHPDDMASEIKELGIVPQLADSIASAVSRRIFEPLKDDLLASYAPPSKFDGLGPKIIEEIKKPEVSAPPIKVSEIPTPASPELQRGEPPSPFAAPPPLPIPPMMKMEQVMPQSAGRPTSGPVDEFARLGLDMKTEAPKPFLPPLAGGPQPINVEQSKPPAESAPAILQEESLIKPLRSASGFRLDIPLSKLSDVKVDKGPQMRPAVLELGVAGAPPAPQVAPPKPPRVVHYTEFRTPLTGNGTEVPKPPAGQAPEREIQEITAGSPPPPMPPAA